MQTFGNLTIILLFISTILPGQNPEIDRLVDSELKMTFPSIYFKHNSTDYATMPYTVDSCFKYIALNIKDINSRPIWRDSSETEHLTNERIKKLKLGLNKYPPTKRINIQSMRKEQKISQRTIFKDTDSAQIQYLLSLNSVFDISGVIKPKKLKEKKHFRIGSAFDLASIKHKRQVAKQNRKKRQEPVILSKEKKQRKGIPHLVWCGWKYGFHWSSKGKTTKKT